MKVKYIALAVAASLAAPSAFAAAVGPIYISGASALTKSLKQTLTDSCNVALVTTASAAPSTGNSKYECANAKAVAGFTAAGDSFTVYKRDAGGSEWGVGPVREGQAIPFGSYGGVAVNAVPTIGLSDVGTRIWIERGQYTPVAPKADVKSFFVAGQGFGVAVSASLYTDLQVAQGLPPTERPSIAYSQYANLVSDTSGLNLNAILPGSSNVLTLSRRVATSGTQAASDLYFLRNPCEKGTKLGGALSPVGAGSYPDANGTANQFIVKEQSGTGGVLTDLSGAGYVIGVVSLENIEPASSWKFVKLDGISPVVEPLQKANTTNGLYDFAFELELLHRSAAGNDPQGVPFAKTVGLANYLKGIFGDGSKLAVYEGIYADPLSGKLPSGIHTHIGSRGSNECKPHVFF